MAQQKLLIIRFSSLGDIVHAMECASAFKARFPGAQVDWMVRADFADFLSSFADVDQVFALPRSSGLPGLLKLVGTARRQGYTHVYDAHSNIRSRIVSMGLVPPWSGIRFVRRSKERFKRWLLFRWRIQRMPTPFFSAPSFLAPLEAWGIHATVQAHSLDLPETEILTRNRDFLLGAIALAPSAAWELKRWPMESWIHLIEGMPEQRFVLLGGPDDEFCQEIADVAPDRVLNLAGHLSWLESARVIQMSQLLVSGDTGLMHIADFLGQRTVALIGPTAFGYPSRDRSIVIEVDLPCKPCSKDGRGGCSHSEFKHCMLSITPEMVAARTRALLDVGGSAGG